MGEVQEMNFQGNRPVAHAALFRARTASIESTTRIFLDRSRQ
jgi:hypothetical protein